ncbi:MAG TPA: primosomal protein N' [Candidatus Saccharimonadales bacterium]|nr:primosomal protein N' [Candidatus Saccharimonadales bacterium]
MQYLEVLVAEAAYHGSEALTYSYTTPLAVGQLVLVPLRNRTVLGVVAGVVNKPHFAVKPIISAPALPALPMACLGLLNWLRSYYPAPLGVLTQLFLPKALPKKPLPILNAEPINEPRNLPALTAMQQKALESITATGSHLLHGDTGSGKTRVYVELTRRTLAQGRSAMILTPEISLTPQLTAQLQAAFGERVVLMHSGLTEASRARNWQLILEQAAPLVIVGARSALFSPLNNLGLIVIDEAHETAYKQDQAPYYHATTVAAKLAQLHSAALVLGTATPLVTDYYIASAKSRPIIRMDQAAIKHDFGDRSVQIVDLKDRSLFSRSPFLSSPLLAVLGETLEKHEQALLFLNRRGTARVVFCDNCGWQAACPHCDLPLVYHGDTHLMRCHSCDYKAATPTSCPQCGRPGVVFKSIGTKAVAEEIHRLFPDARVQRFDTDNKKSERIEQHYDKIHTGEVDVLVGTQTLAKGLDLPKLSLVGVVIADTSLYFPDFSAGERTYQLLQQVIGRIGRGHRAGSAVIQTYNPDSPLLEAVITNNWQSFYEGEIAERQTYHFPPFCYVLKLVCKRASSAAAEKAAHALAQEIARSSSRLTIDGPAPSFHERTANKYAWQLIIKSNHRGDLTQIISKLPSGWSYDIDPMNLL